MQQSILINKMLTFLDGLCKIFADRYIITELDYGVTGQMATTQVVKRLVYE